MVGTIIGALVGGAVVWMWRDQLAARIEEKTRTLRTKAAEGLDAAGKQAEEFLDRAKPQITNTLRAGSEAVRPSEQQPQTGSPGPQAQGQKQDREPSRRVS